jgi:hypothetical protein
MDPPVAPSWTAHVTAVFDEPVTALANCFCVLTWTVVEVGLTVTATAGAPTVTVARASLVRSATEVAVTWNVPAAAGAV